MTTFPLSAAEFFETLKLASCLLRPSWGQQSSGQGSGKIITKDLRPQLWLASIETGQMLSDEWNDLSTWVEIMGESRGSFWAYDTKKQFPKLDPDGALLGAAEPAIADRDGNFSIALTGLPAGYVLSFGDLVGWSDGTSQHLHRIGETVTADGDGDTELFAVTPKISALTIADIPVTLIRPPVELSIVPGSYQPRPGKFHTTRTATFEAMQRYN